MSFQENQKKLKSNGTRQLLIYTEVIRIHSVTIQKTVLFIVTAVRTSNPMLIYREKTQIP
jgi:hypothetical protein